MAVLAAASAPAWYQPTIQPASNFGDIGLRRTVASTRSPSQRRQLIYHDDCQGIDGLGVAFDYIKIGIRVAHQAHLQLVANGDMYL